MSVPLEALIEKTRRIGAGDLSEPLQVTGPDHLPQLASALNAMCAQLAAARERARRDTRAGMAEIEERGRSQRNRAIERLASGVAHELGTPLNVVSVRAELIIEQACSEDVVASANVIRAQVDAMAGVLRRMLDFVRRTPPQKVHFDLVRLISRTTDSIKAGMTGNAIHFQIDGPPESLFIEADPEQIETVLRNLLLNAVQALPDGGTIGISLERGNYEFRSQPRAGALTIDCARIQVRDNGIGISREALSRIFDPFFTTKRAGAGASLGLSVASCIVEDHGGWIDVESKPGEGASFSIFLPLSAGTRERGY
jgi:two-component system, NtrC family, sensor kinase